MELGSHHGSQQGSAAASSFEEKEMDEDEAAAAADFTPMTEEKRIFVNEWIAKLDEDLPDEQDPIEVTDSSPECGLAADLHNCTFFAQLLLQSAAVGQQLTASSLCMEDKEVSLMVMLCRTPALSKKQMMLQHEWQE